MDLCLNGGGSKSVCKGNSRKVWAWGKSVCMQGQGTRWEWMKLFWGDGGGFWKDMQITLKLLYNFNQNSNKNNVLILRIQWRAEENIKDILRWISLWIALPVFRSNIFPKLKLWKLKKTNCSFPKSCPEANTCYCWDWVSWAGEREWRRPFWCVQRDSGKCPTLAISRMFGERRSWRREVDFATETMNERTLAGLEKLRTDWVNLS